jgi:hypothetical protein
MSLLALAGTNSATGGYDIENSLKLEDDNTEWLSKTTSSDWNRVKWTASFWVKRGELGATSSNVRFFAASDSAYDFRVRFQGTGDTLAFYNSDSTGSCSQNSTAVFRDTSAWYHIVAVWDTANATAGNRQRLYVNGVEITDFATDTQPAQNQKSVWGKTDDGSGTVTMGIGAQYNYYSGFVQGYCGYMAEWHWVEGQALDPTAFGEVDEDTGIWKPKKYTGTYGTNGFYLDFEDASDLGADASGNGNNWTKNNITSANQATDSPTNNFCTLNPLYNYAYGNTITEGATKIYGAANNWGGGKATFGLTSGKWYWEIKQLANGNTFMGLQTDGEDNISSGNAQSQNTSVVFYTDGTLQYSNGSETTTSAANSIVANSIVGFALDLDSSTQTIKVYLNGSLITAFGSSGTANLSTYNIADKTVFPFVALYDRTVNMNFGGYTVSSISSAETDENGYGTFEYAPPSGYYALCTKNLEEFG